MTLTFELYFSLPPLCSSPPLLEPLRLSPLHYASPAQWELQLMLYYCDHSNFLNLRFQLKLENRRVGSGEREHIEMGLSHQANGNYLLAVKSFTRSLL